MEKRLYRTLMVCSFLTWFVWNSVAQTANEPKLQAQPTIKKEVISVSETGTTNTPVIQHVTDYPVYVTPAQANQRLNRDFKIPSFSEYRQLPKPQPRDPQRTPINQ